MKLRPEAIRHRMDLSGLIIQYATTVQLMTGEIDKKFEDRNYDSVPLAAFVHVFSDRDLENFVDFIVQFTYDETFKMIKRNMENVE